MQHGGMEIKPHRPAEEIQHTLIHPMQRHGEVRPARAGLQSAARLQLAQRVDRVREAQDEAPQFIRGRLGVQFRFQPRGKGKLSRARAHLQMPLAFHPRGQQAVIELVAEPQAKIAFQTVSGFLQRFQRITRAAFHGDFAGQSGGNFARGKSEAG